MPESKHRKNRKPRKPAPPLTIIWTNDEWDHAPALPRPHVQCDELAGVPMVTVWDYPSPSYITLGLLGAALQALGGTPESNDTIEALKKKLTLRAADEAIAAVKGSTPDTQDTPDRMSPLTPTSGHP